MGERIRDKAAEDVIMASSLFNTGDAAVDREAAKSWGEKAYRQDPDEPFVPYLTGPALFMDAGCHWPTNYEGELLRLNYQKGALPENADLEFGVTVDNALFHGIKRTTDGGFFALISGNVHYAEKLA